MSKPLNVVVIGVGGGGGRVVEAMHARHGNALLFALVNSDLESLASSPVRKQVPLRRGDGGVPTDRAAIQAVAEMADAALQGLLRGVDRCCVIATLGGAAGSGASPVVVRLAQGLQIPTLVVGTLPFAWEGTQRRVNADHAQHALDENATRALWVDLDGQCKMRPEMMLDEVTV